MICCISVYTDWSKSLVINHCLTQLVTENGTSQLQVSQSVCVYFFIYFFFYCFCVLVSIFLCVGEPVSTKQH